MINLSFLIRQISLITLLTVGVSLEMIGGVIDLAFAAQLSASALIGIFLIAGGCPVWVGCIGILFFNFFLGFLKAVFLVKLRVPSIIFTLAMQVILSNFLLATVDYTGIVIPELRESYRGNIYIGMELAVTVLCVAGAFFFLEKTYYGKYCRMLGENLPLARESGVKCFGISVAVHLFASLFFSISEGGGCDAKNAGNSGCSNRAYYFFISGGWREHRPSFCRDCSQHGGSRRILPAISAPLFFQCSENREFFCPCRI